MINKFNKSNSLMDIAEKLIPLGTQTFSKSKYQFPINQSPLFLKYGRGGCVWDLDNNMFVDLICGLLPVILGYCDEDVDNAIKNQLKKGISFSLATDLEVKLAEKLVKIIPSAEMVRFGKNGTDATSAAVRLARSYTKKNNILVCGYHGWQDWYIGSTSRSHGVPKSIQKLTHKVPYNDLGAINNKIRELSGDVAGLIIEPMNSYEPIDNYFDELRELLHKNGSLLIFDEVITGFRFANGGAQQLFKADPDLSSFGKGMGNGMPISAVVGKSQIMSHLKDVFFSSTFGGEALSLAASCATIDKIIKNNVTENLFNKGSIILKNTKKNLDELKLNEVINIVGHPSWSILNFKSNNNASNFAIKSLFIKTMIENGVLISGSNNICFAHNHKDLNLVLKAYEQSFEKIAHEIKKPDLDNRLGFPIIKPVFKPR